jgi:hypothetical protein
MNINPTGLASTQCGLLETEMDLMKWSNGLTVAARQTWEPAPRIASATAQPTGHGRVS